MLLAEAAGGKIAFFLTVPDHHLNELIVNNGERSCQKTGSLSTNNALTAFS
jgi:hypothetical protein